MINIHPFPGFTDDLMPITPPPHKGWWQDNIKTKNHAQHCLPLAMANSLGYYILSPVTFRVSWNGDVHTNAKVEIIGESNPYMISDDHAAFGSFTIQPGFLVTTDTPGDFIMIKSLPNERCQFFSCMEALIEAWWSRARFGLVCLLNRPGDFIVNRGDPIAQMCVYRAEAGFHEIKKAELMPPEYKTWAEKREKSDYRKDLDYFKGLHPDGAKEPTHIHYWTRKK